MKQLLAENPGHVTGGRGNFDEALSQFETSLISFADTICGKIARQNQELENVSFRLSALEESFGGKK